MKKFVSIILSLMLAVCGIPAAAEASTIIYVAPGGNDAASGTADNPLATLEGARNKVRSIKENAEGEITVYFREGVYLWNRTVKFDARDSGKSGKSVRYLAYPGEKVIFTGGTRIAGSEFSAVEGMNENIRQINIKDYITNFKTVNNLGETCLADWYPLSYDVMSQSYSTYEDYNKLYKNTVFKDDTAAYNEYMASYGTQGRTGSVKRSIYSIGEKAALWHAEYPNRTAADGAEAENPYPVYMKTGASSKDENGKGVMRYSDNVISKYAGYNDVWLEHYGTVFYHDMLRIESIDSETKTLKTAVKPSHNWRENANFRIFNALGELDAPGEMYIDKTSGMMYVYPNGDLDNSYMNAAVFVGDYMIETEKASFLEFGGITFENTQGSGIKIYYGENVTVNGCDFLNIGNEAVVLGSPNAVRYWQLPNELETSGKTRAELIDDYNSFYNSESTSTAALGKDHSLRGLKIKNTGKSSVSVTGGNSWRNEECGYSVENCDISYPGVYKPTYTAAISLSNVYGIKILNNRLAHSKSQLIYGSLLKGEIAGNIIYGAMSAATDNGMIYLNYTVTGLDIDIHNNMLRQIPPDNEGKLTERFGIYFDAGTVQGLKIRNNIFMNLTSAMQKPVINSDVTGNVLVNCTDIHSKYAPAMRETAAQFMYPAAESEDFYKSAANACLTQNLPAGTREWNNILTLLPVFGDGETGKKYTALWQKKYPRIMQYLDIVKSQKHMGDFFVNVRDNLIVNTDTVGKSNDFKFEDMKQYTPSGCVIDNNIYTDSTDCFEDFENNNLTVKPQFAAEHNLNELPLMSKMGISAAKTGTEYYRENGTMPKTEGCANAYMPEYADGVYKVKKVSASRNAAAVTFDENVQSASADVYEISVDKIRKIAVSGSTYQDGKLVLNFAERLDVEKQYELRVKFGPNLDNTYLAYLKFEILNKEESFAGGVYSLENDNKLHEKYSDYTVEFTCASLQNGADVIFYANENYNKDLNCHGAVGTVLSSNAESWSYYAEGETVPLRSVSAEGNTNVLNQKNAEISASVMGKNLSLEIYDSYGARLCGMKSELPLNESKLKYSFGTFGTSTAATNLLCYRAVVYSEEYPIEKTVDIPFEKNADTIAKTDKQCTADVTDINGDTVKTIEADYAEIDSETWFAGIPESNFGMYLSGLKSSFFEADGRMLFRKVYRKDETDSDGSAAGSRLCTESAGGYEMYIPPQGFAAKENDAFVIINDPGKSWHAPTFAVELNKTATSAVRFAAQTNTDRLTVTVEYADETADTHTITTGQCRNITYSGKWRDFNKYFVQKGEEVNAGIIGIYGRANGQALYPNNYRREYTNNVDYSAAKDIENAVSGDIRISEKGIRYYEPQIFLFEVKTNTEKIPVRMTVTAAAARPTVIYSAAQCEIYSVPKFNDINVSFSKNADTVADTNSEAEVNIEDINGNMLKTVTAKYAEVNMNTWFNGMPQNRYHMYFSGLASSAFADGIAKFTGIYREDTQSESGEVTYSRLVYDSGRIYKMRIEGCETGETDAFLLRNCETETAHAPSMTASLSHVPTEYVRFAAQTSYSKIKVSVTYTDGTVQTNDIETNFAGNAVYSGNKRNYGKYFAKEDEEVSAGIIGICELKNNTALYPYNYYSRINDTNADYCATKDIENTVSGDIRISEGRIRYYNPKLFLFEIETDSSKIPESITLSVSNEQPTLIYSMMQHTVQSVPAVAHGCDITDSGICVTVNENAGCAVRLAVYDKSGKVIAVSSATSRGVLAADMPEGVAARRAEIFLWNEDISPKSKPVTLDFE